MERSVATPANNLSRNAGLTLQKVEKWSSVPAIRAPAVESLRARAVAASQRGSVADLVPLNYLVLEQYWPRGPAELCMSAEDM